MKKMMQALFVVAFALAALSCSGADDPKEFVNEAAQGGMSEVQLGSLAIEHAGSDAVRHFGQMMVSDHSLANSELKALAKRKNMDLPAEVSSSQKSISDKLAKLNGAEFDKEYVDTMVKDHEDDVKEFQSQADKSKDEDVKAYAAKTLPTLQKHLQLIRDIKSKM